MFPDGNGSDGLMLEVSDIIHSCLNGTVIRSRSTQKMILRIDLPEELALILAQRALEINLKFDDTWTPETLAASLLSHVLIDDEANHALQ